jgi:hypothetical protein
MWVCYLHNSVTLMLVFIMTLALLFAETSGVTCCNHTLRDVSLWHWPWKSHAWGGGGGIQITVILWWCNGGRSSHTLGL